MKKMHESKPMIKHLKATLTDYIHSLTMYDYVAFGWLVLFIVMLIIFGLLFSKKKPKLAIFMILSSFVLMFIAPIAVKLILDKTVRHVEILDQNHTFLNFSKALIVTGTLHNIGKTDLHRCYIKTKVLKDEKNKYLKFLYNLKPLRQRSIVQEANITQDNKEPFKIVFEKFKYDKAYSVVTSVECY